MIIRVCKRMVIVFVRVGRRFILVLVLRVLRMRLGARLVLWCGFIVKRFLMLLSILMNLCIFLMRYLILIVSSVGRVGILWGRWSRRCFIGRLWAIGMKRLLVRVLALLDGVSAVLLVGRKGVACV